MIHLRRFAATFSVTVAATILYGIVQDQITARICIEYFTVGHVRMFVDDDPTRHGLAWGVLGSWWGGIMLAIPLSIAATIRRVPTRRTARRLLILFAVVAAGAFLAGLTGGVLSAGGTVQLGPPFSVRLPPDRHTPFLIDAWAHLAAYAISFVGGIGLVIYTAADR